MTIAAVPAVRADDTPSTAPTESGAFGPPIFSSNALAYVYGPAYRTPYVTSTEQPRGADIARNALQFGHVDSWKYGHNLVEIIAKSSSSAEPAAGGGSGAMEIYGVFRSGLSLNRITGRPIVQMGALRDIDLQVGANLMTKNTAYAPNERTLYLGPRFNFVIGSGFINVGLQLRKEWNRNGLLGKNENYDVGFNVEPYWSFPISVDNLRFVFDGFADYNTPKGRDVSGHQTRAEFLVLSQLKVDIGTALGLAPNKLRLGVGVEYWNNMYGKDANVVPGARQTTPVMSLTLNW